MTTSVAGGDSWAFTVELCPDVKIEDIGTLNCRKQIKSMGDHAEQMLRGTERR